MTHMTTYDACMTTYEVRSATRSFLPLLTGSAGLSDRLSYGLNDGLSYGFTTRIDSTGLTGINSIGFCHDVANDTADVEDITDVRDIMDRTPRGSPAILQVPLFIYLLLISTMDTFRTFRILTALSVPYQQYLG